MVLYNCCCSCLFSAKRWDPRNREDLIEFSLNILVLSAVKTASICNDSSWLIQDKSVCRTRAFSVLFALVTKIWPHHVQVIGKECKMHLSQITSMSSKVMYG